MQETSGAAVLANILTGLGVDEFLTRTDVAAGTTSSFLPATLGSALALADAAGVAQTEYTYEPFGRTTVTATSNSNSFQFTGRENDATGLYYYRARYFHPELQRFISEDPILSRGNPDIPFLLAAAVSDPGKLHPFTYVMNNPIMLIDPFGLEAVNECIRKANEWFDKCNIWFNRLRHACGAFCMILQRLIPLPLVQRLCTGMCVNADKNAQDFCREGYGELLKKCIPPNC